MFKSAVTICLFPEGKSGPFLFHGELATDVQRAAEIGFDAVELFAPSDQAIDAAELRRLLDEHNLKLAAVGTGEGFVLHRLTLTDPDSARRSQAMDFARRMIDLGGPFGAPAIVGSMQGRHGDGERDPALSRFTEALSRLADHAKPYFVPLLYEPLNRYETNIFNRQGDAASFIRSRQIPNVKILADLFHMNIEESDISRALLDIGDLLGHVHFVDSNRRAAGLGHIDYPPIIDTLRQMRYQGYLSAEALPIPDSQTAARQTIQTFKRLTTDH